MGFIITLNVNETFMDGGIHSFMLASWRSENVFHPVTFFAI